MALLGLDFCWLGPLSTFTLLFIFIFWYYLCLTIPGFDSLLWDKKSLHFNVMLWYHTSLLMLHKGPLKPISRSGRSFIRRSPSSDHHSKSCQGRFMQDLTQLWIFKCYHFIMMCLPCMKSVRVGVSICFYFTFGHFPTQDRFVIHVSVF